MAGTAAPSKTIVTVAPVARRLILMQKNGKELGELEPRSWRVLMRLETKWKRMDDASLLLLLLLLLPVHSCLAHA